MATGLAGTYDLTVGVKLDIEDMIYILTPSDVPMLGTYNGSAPVGPAPQRAAVSRESTNEKKFEWLEDELLTPRTTLGATATTAAAFITVASGQRERFTTGDIVLIDSETLRITGYGNTADTLTVSRSFGAAAAAQHVNAAEVVGVGTALKEGANPGNARYRDRANKHNLTQIFGPHKIEITGTEEVVGKYGVRSEFDYQVAARSREMWVSIEQALLYGERVDDTTNKWRSTGGLDFYIDTNKDTTTTALAGNESKLLDQLQKAYNNGGVVDTLIVNADRKREISGFQAPQVRLERAERVRGSVVDVYVSDFGMCDVILNRHMRKANVFGIDRQYVSCVTLNGREAKVTPLAITGDHIDAMLLTEKGFKVRMEQRHFKFTALT